MIESLITSKTRIKLLLKFFLNSQTTSYLRSLESEFGESTNSIRVELNRLENAGLLGTSNEGNKKMFFANTKHPLFHDINNIIKKFIGIDQIIEQITSQIGKLQVAYVTGDFAIGKDSKIIDLALVGNDLNRSYIETLVEKAEQLISRRIKYIILTNDEMLQFYSNQQVLLIWKADEATKSIQT
ncbi:MAG TPA: ArsR family transcriptional regulator [Prolixibacteraceae bacterium]|nr:ArsR family transcriptional regulator [Prolixibacteraceae bacterium]